MPKTQLPAYDNLVSHALTRGLKPAELSPGDYHVCGRAELELHCSLNKGVQTSARAQFKPVWARVVGQLLKGLKVPSGRVAAMLAKSIAAAESSARLDDHTLAAQACLENLAEAQPQVPRAGNTKLAGTVKLVQFTPSN